MITTPTVQERNWGQEITVVKTATHCGKVLKRKAGTKGGFQFHMKEESHYLVEGRMLLRSIKQGKVVETEVEAGSAWTVSPGTVHQEEALTDCTVFEVSDPTENDRYAIEPDPGGLPPMTDEDAMAILWHLIGRLGDRMNDCSRLHRQIGKFGLASLVPQR